MMNNNFTIEGKNTRLASQPWLGQQVVETPKKEITINLNLAGASASAAAAAVMAARMSAEDIPDYMDFLGCPQQQPQMPALPEPAPAESSFTRKDMLEAVGAAVAEAMKPFMASSLEPVKVQKKQQLENDFANAIAGKPAAEVVKLSKQLAAAEAKVDAATTATEIAAVKL